MKKIGLICLALVLALTSMGFVYAKWSDTITVNGTVKTGDVDLNVVQYSGTDIYKMPDKSMSRVHWYTNRPAPPEGALLVAYAIAEAGLDDDTVVFTFYNLFPCQDFIADWLMNYHGSIPAHINVSYTVEGIPAEWVVVTKSDGMAGYDYSYPLPVPPAVWQMHEGDYGALYVAIHVPQLEEAMNLTGKINMTIEAVQFNE